MLQNVCKDSVFEASKVVPTKNLAMKHDYRRQRFLGKRAVPTKPKNRTNSAKEFFEQFEGVAGQCPVKQGFLRQIAPESSPGRSAKSLSDSHSFFVAPFLCETQMGWRLRFSAGAALVPPVSRDTARLSQRYPPSLRAMGS